MHCSYNDFNVTIGSCCEAAWFCCEGLLKIGEHLSNSGLEWPVILIAIIVKGKEQYQVTGMERAAWMGWHRDVYIDAGMMFQLPSYCSRFKMPAERVC